MIDMDSKQLTDRITEVVAAYIADEELYDDNALVVVNPASGEVALSDGDDDVDDEANDVYEVMDLIRMNPDGVWEPDADAIAEAAEQ